MKTKNNVQKTVFKPGMVIIILMLISCMVGARDFYKSNEFKQSSGREIAVVSKIPAGTGYHDELAYEPELKLENWMISENYFKNSPLFFKNVEEKTLELENWMLDEGTFIPNNNREEPLKVEHWMISADLWKGKKQ